MNSRKSRLSKLFMDRSIRTKILICMLPISLLAICVSSIFFYSISYREQIAQAQNAAQIKVKTASSTVADTIATLFNNMVTFVETPQVVTLFDTAHKGEYITANMLADSLVDLLSLARTSNLLEAILLITPQGEYYSNKNIRLRPECSSMDVWADHTNKIFNWLSARPTPYVVPEKNVIPLSYSMSYYKGIGRYVSRLSVSNDDVVFRLFFFFDYGKFISLLQSDDTDPLSITYLADEDMRPITMIPESYFYPVVSDAAFIAQTKGREGDAEIIIGKNGYLVNIGRQIVSGLRVVNITSKQELMTGYRKTIKMINLTFAVTVLAAIVLSTFMTRRLTRPLMRLTESVRSIGSKHPPETFFVPHYKDEIGVLGTAIERMCTTISEQMDTIKEEERKRANAEIQILTQQINPHFIYNTLDCIRWEILNNNIEGSSGMVESLAQFLRLGFSHRGDSMSVREEVTRVEQYVSIMRMRNNGAMQFSSYIDVKLREFQIPKMILQPLVENAFKHGFSPDVFNDNQQTREIFVRCIFLPEGSVSLAIEDNGAGIDVERARLSVNLNEQDPSSGNIGLRNSYLRMRAFFGAENVEIRFASTPFFLNRVEYVITLPPKGKKETEPPQ